MVIDETAVPPIYEFALYRLAQGGSAGGMAMGPGREMAPQIQARSCPPDPGYRPGKRNLNKN